MIRQNTLDKILEARCVLDLDILHEYITNNFGHKNVADIISRLRAIDNYIIGFYKEDGKSYYVLLKELNGPDRFPKGFAEMCRKINKNNKYSSVIMWTVTKHFNKEFGEYYTFDNFPQLKDKIFVLYRTST